MPLLLYCVALETAPDTDVSGVGGAVVRGRIESALKFFYSKATSDSATRDVVAAAQTVHRVVSDIFARTAVLPFQYPTLVADEREMAKLALDRGKDFRTFLERVGSKVQMDIRLTLASEAHPVSTQAGRVDQTGSGTQYLHARAHRQATLYAAAETCRLAAGSNGFRSNHRGENIRCQVLMERVEVVSFLERMRTLELPGGVKAAVSGPWPPAGFWEDEPR